MHGGDAVVRRVVRAREIEGFAGGFELEIRMQRLAGDCAVFVGEEDDEVIPPGERGGGEGPLEARRGVIAEAPAGEARGRVAVVIEFHPVGRAAVFIAQAGVVLRTDFIEHHAAGVRHGCRCDSIYVEDTPAPRHGARELNAKVVAGDGAVHKEARHRAVESVIVETVHDVAPDFELDHLSVAG